MSRLARWVLLVVLGGLVVGVSAAAAAAPAAPALVGSVSNAFAGSKSLSGATSVAVSGRYAYTTSYWGGVLTAVDISSPAAPFPAGSSAVATSLLDGSTVNIANGYAFVASKNRNASHTSNNSGDGNSLTILDIHTTPAVPAIVGTLHDSMKLFGAYGVAVSGGFAYVASQGLLAGQPTAPSTSTGSFSVISLSNQTKPAIVGHLDNGSLPVPWTASGALDHVTSAYVSGHYAYVTAFNSDRLTIIDISNPASPTIVSSLHDNVNLAFPSDVAVSGNYAYVADQTAKSTESNFTIVDISNPASPRVVGSVVGQNTLLAGAYRVRVYGRFAYLSASNTATVAAIDISDPANPRLAGSVTSTANLFKTTGLDFDPSGGYIIASSPLAANESNPLFPPYTMTTGTITAIQLDPVPIAVTIAPASEPPSATTQTSASFAFATSDQIATVPQCRLDAAPFSACTSPTTQSYGSLSIGSHTFTVQTTDALGNPATASYTWTVDATSTAATVPPVATKPANAARPAVSGAAAIGQTLTCARGAWTGSSPITYAYAWTRDGTTIAGATRDTHRIAAADAKHKLACVVRATNSLGTAAAASAWLPAPAGRGQIRRAGARRGGTTTVKVSCASIPGTVCHLSLMIVVPSKTSQTVVLANKSLTLRAGKHKTIKLSLDRAGHLLLAKHHKLAAILALVEVGSNGQARILPGRRLTLRRR
jgi:hypothetical protein